MRRLEVLLLACDLLALVVIVVPLRSPPRWVRAVALAALPVAVAQVLLEGPRWQRLSAYALAATFFLVWLLTAARSSRPPGESTSTRRAGLGLLVSLGAVALAIAAFLPWVLPVFRLPRPSGPYGIGTVTYHWVDAGRHEVFSADPTARRELMVQLWYPTKGVMSPRRASYVPYADALGPSWARLTHLPAFTVSHFRAVTTNAVPSAPVAGDQSSYPVLVYLTGLGGFRQLSTFQIEELVSQGYIVAGLDQPYTAAAVVFPDGRRVAGLDTAQARGLIERPDQVRDLIEQSVRPVDGGAHNERPGVPGWHHPVSRAGRRLHNEPIGVAQSGRPGRHSDGAAGRAARRHLRGLARRHRRSGGVPQRRAPAGLL